MDIGRDDRNTQGPIESRNLIGCLRIRRAKDDTVRIEEVLHSRAFAQEFGIRDDREAHIRSFEMGTNDS
jgi:hypothetical protein